MNYEGRTREDLIKILKVRDIELKAYPQLLAACEKIKDVSNLGIANDTYTAEEMINKLDEIWNICYDIVEAAKGV